MKKRIIAALLLALLLITPILSSCASEPHKRYVFGCFDTNGVIRDFSGSDKKDFEKRADEIEKLLSEYSKQYDIYFEYSGINNLKTVNENAGRGAVKVDGAIIDLLEFGKEMYALTRGEVNIAFGAVLRIWHEFREAGVGVPDKAELEAAALHTDIDDVVIDREAGTVELLDPEMSLDVGAIAKGYAVERAARYIESMGYGKWTLDIGGNVRTVGIPEAEEGLPCAIRNPDGSGNYLATLSLKNSALITSGNYERFYTVDGVRYHHIIDKDTLFPKNTYSSVSVHAPSSATADALSTAVFNMDEAEVREFILTLSQTEFIILRTDGNLIRLSSED